MCRKIRCDGESWKVFGFWGELNKASSFMGMKLLYIVSKIWMRWKLGHETPTEDNLICLYNMSVGVVLHLQTTSKHEDQL